MDENTLNDLLECSVCLERLDTASKVLPCQHTFCRKCLEVIIASRKELRCPECRVLVDVGIDELPPNVLLMRILEGLKNASTHPNTLETNDQKKIIHDGSPNNIEKKKETGEQNVLIEKKSFEIKQRQIKENQATPNTNARVVPRAFALYDFHSKEKTDLSFKKGDIILIKRKVDINWFYGQLTISNGQLGKEGTFPINYVHIIVPLPQPSALALYDFKMGPNEEEGCLTFKKGQLISVLRRVDQNWAEGRIGNCIGIFPIAFAEMNVLAKQLLNEQHTNVNALNAVVNVRALPPIPISEESSSTSTSSSNVTSPTCSSSTSSMDNCPLQQNQTNEASSISTAAAVPEKRNLSQKEKRNSLTALSQQQNTLAMDRPQSNRHSAEILSMDLSEASQSKEKTEQKSRIVKSRGNVPGPHSLPWAYMALYPYKPKKQDELELKKGCVYFVTERCLDGWFKGKNWENKSGVFPGNYVTPLKSRDNTQVMHQRKHSIQPNSIESGGPSSTIPAPDLPLRSGSSNLFNLAWSKPLGQHMESILGRKSSELNQKTSFMATNNNKEKSESSSVGGLMKRLSNMNKRSKSPLAQKSVQKSAKSGNFSADNPVFEDVKFPATVQVKASSHPVHVRSGSCPSQLLQNLPVDAITAASKYAKYCGSSSQRIKNKERPAIEIEPNRSKNTSLVDHRKTQSLDANCISNSNLIKESANRFRCIVSYPPNSELELELNVGDIVTVHRKLKNGWCRGTKNGKTGLFPASFVEPDV